MPRKCPHCNGSLISRPISKLPLWEGDPFKSKFKWEALKWRNLNLKNLIIGDWINFMVIVSILFVAWAYLHDSAAYREIYNNPCNFVKNNIDACLTYQEQVEQQVMLPNLSIILIPLEEEVEK